MNSNYFELLKILANIYKSDKNLGNKLFEIIKHGGIEGLGNTLSGNIMTTNLRFWDDTTSKQFIGTGSNNWTHLGFSKLNGQDIRFYPTFSGNGNTGGLQQRIIFTFQTDQTIVPNAPSPIDWTGVYGWYMEFSFYGTDDPRLRAIGTLDGNSSATDRFIGFVGNGAVVEDINGRGALKSVSGFESRWPTSDYNRISQTKYFGVYIENTSTSDITINLN